VKFVLFFYPDRLTADSPSTYRRSRVTFNIFLAMKTFKFICKRIKNCGATKPLSPNTCGGTDHSRRSSAKCAYYIPPQKKRFWSTAAAVATNETRPRCSWSCVNSVRIPNCWRRYAVTLRLC
jgi:hypothetical protein